jgi:hypothetical protein
MTLIRVGYPSLLPSSSSHLNSAAGVGVTSATVTVSDPAARDV